MKKIVSCHYLGPYLKPDVLKYIAMPTRIGIAWNGVELYAGRQFFICYLTTQTHFPCFHSSPFFSFFWYLFFLEPPPSHKNSEKISCHGEGEKEYVL